uniref:Tumor protein p53 inducible protein 3 n=1 Tax=Anas zonorhyncha TaxID=75864 RepID=A0A8B9U8B9_9AVES
ANKILQVITLIDWKIGDAVMALLSGGGQAEYVTVPEGCLMPAPNDMTLIQAAAIPEAWLTAFQLLHFVGKIQKGERVLIHAGASGVGMAAIQLVKLANAIPIVTAGTQEKLKATANAGAAAGFDYKNEDFSEKVLAFTQGQNILKLLKHIVQNQDEIKRQLGRRHANKILQVITLIDVWLFLPYPLFCFVLEEREVSSPQRKNVLPYFAQGASPRLQPFVDSIYPLHEIAEAHRAMEENRNIGKIVIEMPVST